MTDAVMDFLTTGAIPKSAPPASTQAAASARAESSDDPVHDWMASGGANTPTVAKEAKSYFQRVKDAYKASQDSADKAGFVGGMKAAGEMALNTVTAGPVSLLKHGVEEGAYLSGQSPEQAQNTAARVIPTDGYQPQTEEGKNLSALVGTVAEPLVDAGRWAAEKVGLSPAAQNLAGDFAPVIIPTLVSKAPGVVRDIGSGTRSATTNARGAVTAMNDRFQELQRIGRGEPPLNAAPTTLTPQMIRGQEPIPAQIQNAPSAAPAPNKPLGAPVPESSMPARAAPAEAPALSIENASPQLKQALAGEGPSLSPQALQRHVEADSLPVPVSLTAGQATGDLARLSDEMNMRADHPELQRRFNEQNGQMIENVNAIRERVAPDVTDTNHVQNGEALINAYKTIDEADRAAISEKYAALRDANGGQFPVDGKAFVDAADQALKREMKGRYLPAEIKADMEELRAGGPMTFENFENMRTNLAADARKADRAGDGNQAHAISVVREALESLPIEGESAALKPLADAARSAAKARFDRIKADPAYKAAVQDTVAPDDFVRRFVINGKAGNVKIMRDALAIDPIATQTISAGVLNYLKERAGTPNDAGNFSQAGYNKALNALRPKLDSLFDPVAAQQVETLGKVARYTQEQPRGSYVNNSNTFTSAVKGTAKAAVGGALNKATYGLSGALGEAMEKGRAKGAVEDSLKPAAGVKLSDIPKTR